MPRSLQVGSAGLPGPKPSPALGRDTTRRVLVRRHDSSPLAPWVVAGALLLITTEATKAQGVGAPAAIAMEGPGSLGLGALVGAVVAGAFAMRERFRRD